MNARVRKKLARRKKRIEKRLATLGLPEAIDERLHLLKIHLPYHESDHVLNLAYNALCDGTCPQDIELRRNDEVFLDALDARRIPDPTTAGDFCRRFEAPDVYRLRDIINDVRKKAWAGQPPQRLPPELPAGRGAQEPVAGEGRAGAVRRLSLLLLHHQRP